VDGIAPVRLVERRLADDVSETIRAVLEPVGPGGEHLPPASRVDLTCGELPDDRLGVKPEGTKARADLSYDGAHVAMGESDLLA
jgi:hypothetical protein